jgi:hypothetical protein
MTEKIQSQDEGGSMELDRASLFDSTGKSVSQNFEFIQNKRKMQGLKEKEASRDVDDVFYTLLNRKPSKAEADHYFDLLNQGELDKSSLEAQISSTLEYRQHVEAQNSRIPKRFQYWMNRFHPWICEEDQANESVGTVRWVCNLNRSDDDRWLSKEVLPGYVGAEVLDGKLFFCNQDSWISVSVLNGLNDGHHVWHIKRVQR